MQVYTKVCNVEDFIINCFDKNYPEHSCMNADEAKEIKIKQKLSFKYSK